MPGADVIIIGSGLAALSAAYHLHHKKNITIITKAKWLNSNSMLAQGGIAAALSKNDSWLSHFEDTLRAGNFHNAEDAVIQLVQEGPEDILGWIDKGMPFDKDRNGDFLLGKEGAHSHNRIVHSGGDATGKAMTQFIYNKLKNNITITEGELATDLIVKNGKCYGVKTISSSGEVKSHHASKTILATGGVGAVYGHTSNATVITGDGIAMAFRAGAALADMEFIQFHPTMLYANGECVGLISEAVRGEGAFLIDQNGRRIMKSVHPEQDLAPRDIVSRTIFDEINRGNQIYLDISPVHDFEKRFPTITGLCNQHGISLIEGKIPVAPGMHFIMGGVQTNGYGETTIPNLYAVGEVACTGVHGANRLASNSLLEGLVFGRRVAEHMLAAEFIEPSTITHHELFFDQPTKAKPNLPQKSEVQFMMTRYVGIQRTKEELQIAQTWFETFQQQFSFWDINVNDFTFEEVEMLNMLLVGWLITTSALTRTESRGGHYRLDFPLVDDDNWLKKQIVRTKLDMHVGV
ncbi:L-aspartate oxidase [Metabacillus herbersteinensis]|uniref:L-aspartate oxidase n=1 Tax=Metabacillus herbersteinensis TaxID=283816 RepID=A0ABV6GAA4_9BACI